MLSRYFFHGLAAAALASVAAIIYSRIYFYANEVDFSKAVNTLSVLSANLFACMIAVIGYWLLKKWLESRADIIFNFIFAIISFGSITYPIAAKLPLTILNPELFPGLAVPMHFFPALAWFTLNPLFEKK